METIRLKVYRYNPDTDAKPYMQDYELEIEPTDVKLLDAIMKLKAKDDSLSFRRSCREGICGSDGMNINGKKGLACLTDIRSLKQPIVLRPLPGLCFVAELGGDTDTIAAMAGASQRGKAAKERNMR